MTMNGCLITFNGSTYPDYNEEKALKSLAAASLCTKSTNPQTTFPVKTSGESCPVEWEDEIPCSCSETSLSHGSNEIARQKSLLAKPCISFDSFMITNCYKLPNLASWYMGGVIAHNTKDTIPFVPPFSKCGLFGCNNDVNNIIKVLIEYYVHVPETINLN